ncbi:RNA polymerase sigma factor [Prauserella cavernicola]|uniref:Sigma-70 family RNA polymerase sigma factor n=1 Tax=Prauserella cavernicola TaxID=2800127 RepID=A0A934QY58_9PSEU|nr:sigma-70 family RNA polymerase sigma factor [Prauserella cavernicola]MBK1787433.1 sigma-70 family RNA polymerase sigma factor [Prauserella cavernicola]
MTITRLPARAGSGSGPPGSEADDERLLAESFSEPERFAGLFDRHAPVVHGYLARRVGPLADDLLSETFLLAFRGRDGYDPARGPVRAWLFGIATNLVRRHARDEERRYRALGKAVAMSTPSSGEVDTSTADRVDAQAVSAELASALGALPEQDRDVLLLWAYLQLPYAEIAGALEIPIGTVRSRLHRARAAVRAHLGPRWLTNEESA